MTILIAGAGIAGLSLGLTLHQIGVPFRIYESVRELRPLGVGINLQPNAVREIIELGLGDMLDQVGLRTQDYGFYSKTGREIWTEPRGLAAGYKWPQYSVHRGKLQMALAEALMRRAGPQCIVTEAAAAGYRNEGDEAVLLLHDGREVRGKAVIGADGIHSALRAQMYPDEGAPIWGGAILWRGTTLARPFLSGASMVLAGHDTQRLVCYPITPPDPDTGLATINWIAERTFDPGAGWRKEDWNRAADKSEFLPWFEDWTFDWLDVPALIRGAEQVFEYPMVDRDPVESWTEGRVTLIGDAAHPTYPVGSNGASQAIVDGRVLGAQITAHGVGPEALRAYEAQVRPQTTKVAIANRGAGPIAVLQTVEDRSGGVFDRIEDVMSHKELADHAAGYKRIAGFDIEALNARPPLIDPVAHPL
ncbi:MAG: flavin-dependent oxidoreductase [Sulfitobacter sp.]|nr:flavin-dependent oxidoreductase [Sulfitobacter sp.]